MPLLQNSGFIGFFSKLFSRAAKLTPPTKVSS